MPDLSNIVAILVVALVGGMVTGAASLALGGLGAINSLKNRMKSLENSVETVDTRITREVKTRAGQEGVRARQMSEKQMTEEAYERLAKHNKDAWQGRDRPSVAGRGW